MRIIVVSNPEPIDNEAEFIHSLFEEGLEIFHLRKPTYSEQDYQDLLSQIPVRYHAQIALHQHHHLCERNDIQRIHLTEKDRISTTEAKGENLDQWNLYQWKQRKMILSTSIHTLEDYKSLNSCFAYTFFGPVFASISKKDYQPSTDQMLTLEMNEKRITKVIAIGGITPSNIPLAKAANYDGVALLGALWSDPKNLLNVFKDAQRA